MQRRIEGELESIHAQRGLDIEEEVPVFDEVFTAMEKISNVSPAESKVGEPENNQAAGVPDDRGRCPSDQLLCANEAECYHSLRKCNKVVDCSDASDEAGCSCKSYLITERLCDGYEDCENGERHNRYLDESCKILNLPTILFLLGEDEEFCDAPEGKVNCGDEGGTYVYQDELCDNIIDCPNARDERNCFALAPVEDPITNYNVTATPHSKVFQNMVSAPRLLRCHGFLFHSRVFYTGGQIMNSIP